MTDETYRDPQLAINRVYTRKGDAGKTSLVGGQKVAKNALRIDGYGTVDELNAFVGAARQTIKEQHPDFVELGETLLRVQHELFNLGSILATLPSDVGEFMPRVTEKDVEALEQSIDAHNAGLPELRSFVLPGGNRLSVELHQCRTICRRAERLVVELDGEETVDPQALAYLNRLSDAFFVWSRWAAVHGGAEEVLWQPNKSASAQK
ncbi:MAG: cob(I)yrinic acid a,c-diamide adenosyltransferase [bacterium]